MSRHNVPILSALACTMLGIVLLGANLGTDCNFQLPQTGTSTSTSSEPWYGQAIIVNTDYSQGSYSLVDLPGLGCTKNTDSISQDAVCRFDPVTGNVFIVERGSDSVRVLSPVNWSTVTVFQVFPGGNPQDMAVTSSATAFITQYDNPNLLAVNPLDGTITASFDMSSFADADGLPEASWTIALGSTVYVALQRLDRNNFFTPTDHSAIMIFDSDSLTSTGYIHLTGKNVFGKMRFSPALGRIVIPEVGVWGALDGGIEYLDPADNSLSGFRVTEQALGGDILDAVILAPDKGYAILSVNYVTRLVSFNPCLGIKTADILLSDGYDLGYMELVPDGSALWICDRTFSSPGIRIINTLTDSQSMTTPIDTGIAPYMIDFIADPSSTMAG